MQDGIAIMTRPVNARAGVTNEPRRLSADMDLRTHAGRRFSDIYDGLALEFGPGADPERIREMTVLKFQLEEAQSAGTLTLEDTVRVFNLIARKAKELRLAQRRAAAGPPAALRDRLAGRYPAVTGARTAAEGSGTASTAKSAKPPETAPGGS